MSVVAMEAQPPPPTNKLDLNLNMEYFMTPPGRLRVAEGVLALAALISIVEGYCGFDASRYGFLLFVVIVAMLESILILAVFVLRFDEQLSKGVDIPLTLLLNDGIALICFFISSTLALLSVGRCESLKFARLIGALFILSLFIVSVGLNYYNYLRWQERLSEKENGKTSTITESSPTVLT
ncbi:hypothetical protein JTE90_026638 [Oedothorax gibbosus]|uniref:MARVEL domain-containing protein n=1 Tax=Oedothorax gibbosus TaxID=931172 RepID=A0AAV6UA28_9ARAC|nr:hypothetical protein JTE90_026638 [Oedothorax gibbosus]